jgi:alkyl hydroperoxide reductase subunit AhpC
LTFDQRPTFDIASDQIGEYVQPLWQGALALPFSIRDEHGRKLGSADDHLSGKSLVLVFLNDASELASVPVLKAFAEKQADFDQRNATLLAISSSSDAAHCRSLKQKSDFQWPISVDSTGAVFASYGLHKDNDTAIRIVLLTPYRQVRVWFDTPDDINETVNVIMELLENTQIAEEARWAPPHAPILLVPNVLSPEECGQLIQSFETGGPLMVRPPRPGELAGDYKIPVYEHDRQDRVDQIIKDERMLAFIDERIWGRVTPMIQKAFAFEVTRREDLHIARYVGERGGYKMGHRDNTSPATAYRRFALSMSLNDDYEGGEIAFKEFSPRGYRPEAGTAMVFSSSLLHEVQETTSGTRYNLISHFFNEAALTGG